MRESGVLAPQGRGDADPHGPTIGLFEAVTDFPAARVLSLQR